MRGALTRFWKVRKTHYVQDNMSNILEYSAGEECTPKAGHVILSPFGWNSIVIPNFFICGSENTISTLLVSSKSTLVEHGGFVGNRMIQLSQQVSISELANTQGLVARAKLCRNAILQRMFLESSGCCSRSN